MQIINEVPADAKYDQIIYLGCLMKNKRIVGLN